MKNPKNEIYYSQASIWEISIKYSLRKLELSGGTPEEIYKEIRRSFLKCKFFDNDELSKFYKLPKEHKDPFDRIMVWQAINSQMYFLSIDGKISAYEKYGLKIL